MEKTRCNNLACDVTSGKIEVKNVKADNVDINISSGKINASSLEAKNINARATSGTVYINGNSNTATLKVSSGKIDYTSSILPEKLDVDVTSGSIYIKVPENDGFNVDYKVTSGKFSSDFDLMYNNNSGKNGNGKYKQGGNTFAFRVSSGKIKLERI